MAINFDELPQDKPQGFDVLPEGTYAATIKDATIETSKNGKGKYLSVQLKITTAEGKSVVVYDNFFDSDKPLPRYKLGQFIRALKLKLTGSFELSDLPKVIVNKTCMVAVKSEKNEGYAERNVVNAFDDNIYTPVDPLNADLPETSGDTPFDTTEGDAQY